MIDPQVLHGGASSWFWIAACAKSCALGGPEGPPLRTSESATSPFGAAAAEAPATADSVFFASGLPAGAVVAEAGSWMLTPARNCASGDRNFVAIQRKM